MAHHGSTPATRPDSAKRRFLRLGAIFASAAILIASCSSNEGGGASAGASAAASGAAPSAAASGAEPSAAASGAEPSAGASEGAAVSGTLTVWAMGNEGVKLKTLADAFMQENPGTTVNVTPVDWGQAVAKLQTAIAGGQTPDVSQMGTDMMGQFAATGAFETVPEGVDKGKFFEGAWNTNVVEGSTVGVPWYVETRLLYYRKDIAEKAGITAPPATWDELKAAAKAMKEQGGAANGISLGTKYYGEYAPFLWSNGGDITDGQGNFTLNSPQAVEALTFYDSFFEEGLTPTTVPEGFDITPAFVAGTHPMFFSGPWHLSLIKEAGGAGFEDKWAIAPMPKKSSGTSFVGGANLVVYKNSQNKDLAWKFVDYLTKPETQVAWYQEVTVLPAVQAGWDDPAIKSDPNVAMFGEQLKDTKAPPAIPTWSEVAETINDTLEKMTVGNLEPQAAADEMQQKAERIGMGR